MKNLNEFILENIIDERQAHFASYHSTAKHLSGEEFVRLYEKNSIDDLFKKTCPKEEYDDIEERGEIKDFEEESQMIEITDQAIIDDITNSKRFGPGQKTNFVLSSSYNADILFILKKKKLIDQETSKLLRNRGSISGIYTSDSLYIITYTGISSVIKSWMTSVIDETKQ